jgi:hypothetical protein
MLLVMINYGTHFLGDQGLHDFKMTNMTNSLIIMTFVDDSLKAVLTFPHEIPVACILFSPLTCMLLLQLAGILTGHRCSEDQQLCSSCQQATAQLNP